MTRNESVARSMMMWLCFGTAIGALALHWRITSSMTPPRRAVTSGDSLTQVPWQSQQGNKQKAVGSSQKKSSNSLVSKNRVLVDLSDRRVYVYRSNQIIGKYPIAIGKKGWETPTGSFQVQQMQLHPIWRHPITGKIFPAGTNSPLGDRWIGFWSDGRNQIGFHGTPDVKQMGSAVSHGCIRMRNPDVRLLYKQVSLGTPIEVRH